MNTSGRRGGNGASEDLRELARRIQEETDTNKMIELVQELIAKFDEQKLMTDARPPSREDSWPRDRTD